MMHVRDATVKDAANLAELINLAGEGLPAYLWSNMAEAGQDVMAVGAQRAARAEGSFSYLNAKVIEVDAQVAGMVLGYRLPNPYVVDALDELPAVVRPLLELESKVPGSWYINAIAVYETYRRRGLASRMMSLCYDFARSEEADVLSLIVATENTGAMGLYEKLGFAGIDTRPVIQYSGCMHGGDWMLMSKQLNNNE